MKQEIKEREVRILPDSLEETVRILSGVEEELSAADSCGYSVLDWFMKLEEHRKYLGRIAFDDAAAVSIDAAMLSEWISRLGSLQDAAKRCAEGNLRKFALNEFYGANYTDAVKKDMTDMFSRWREEISLFETQYHMFCECFGIVPDESYDSFVILANLSRCFLNGAGLLPELLFSPEFASVREQAEQLLEDGKNYADRYGQLRSRFHDSVFQCDWKRLMAQWREADQSFILVKNKKKKDALKELREYVKHPGAVTEANFVEYIHIVESYEKAYRSLEDRESDGISIFGEVWQGVQTDWDDLEQKLRDSITVYGLVNELFAINPGQQIESALCEASEEFLEFVRRNRVCFQDYLSACDKCIKTEKEIEEIYQISLDRIHHNGWFNTITRKLDAWETHLEELGIWSEFIRAKQSADAVGLGTVTEALKEGTITPDVILPCVWSNLAEKRIGAWVNSTSYSRYLTGEDGEQSLLLMRNTVKNTEKSEKSSQPMHEPGDLYRTIVSRITTELTFAGFLVTESSIGFLNVANKQTGRDILTIVIPGAGHSFRTDAMVDELKGAADSEADGKPIQIIWILDWIQNPNAVIKKLVRHVKESNKKAG